MVRNLPTRSDHPYAPRFSARPGSFCFRLQMYVFFRFVVFSKITIFRKTVIFFIIFPKNTSFFQHTHRFYTLFSENRPIFSCRIREISNFRKFKNSRLFRSKFNYFTTRPIRSETAVATKQKTRLLRTTVILLTISWYNARFFLSLHVRKDTYPILISK